MKFRIAIGFAAAVLASFALGGTDGVILKMTPKVGDSLKYHQVAKLDFAGMEVNFSGTSIHKVLKVEGNGNYSVKEVITENKINGNDAPDRAGPAGSTTTLSAKGELIKIEGDHVNETTYRYANFSLFVLPENSINVGDTWFYEIKENKTTRVVGKKADYTFVAEDKVGQIETYKVKYLIKETEADGGSSEGFIWLRKSDCAMVKRTAKWTNVMVEGIRRVSGDVTVTLVQ